VMRCHSVVCIHMRRRDKALCRTSPFPMGREDQTRRATAAAWRRRVFVLYCARACGTKRACPGLVGLLPCLLPIRRTAAAAVAAAPLQVQIVLQVGNCDSIVRSPTTFATFVNSFCNQVASVDKLSSLGITPTAVNVTDCTCGVNGRRALLQLPGGTSSASTVANHAGLPKLAANSNSMAVQAAIGPFASGVTEQAANAAVAEALASLSSKLSQSFKTEFDILSLTSGTTPGSSNTVGSGDCWQEVLPAAYQCRKCCAVADSGHERAHCQRPWPSQA
jgi:hypothetical protein